MRRTRSFALLIFFVSGAAGLIYEVVWMRMLSLVFGSTVYASATVLTAFMGGMALGGYLLAPRIDRMKSPILSYAILEFGIAIFALLFSPMMNLAESIYVSIHRALGLSFYLISLVRFALALLVLIIPTTLMGATLPAISKGIARRDELGWDVGGLYSVNTLGAVSGTLLAGFVLVRFIGVPATIGFAAVLNLVSAVGAIMIHVGTSGARRPAEESPEKTPLDSMRKTALWIAGISGFCALSYEVFWTRILVFFLGSTTYAFSTMLAAFLFGIAVGSFVFARFSDRFKNTLLILGIVQSAIGALSMLLLPAFGEVYAIGALFRRANWFNFVMGKFLPASIMMFPPTFLMGATFPLVVKLFISEIKGLSRKVGLVYASNTLGSIIGSFAAGFVVIPLVGIQRGVLIVALINLALGLWLMFKSKVEWRVIAPTAAVLLFLDVLLMFFGNKPIILKSAIFRYQRPGGKLLYYDEGVDASVTVLEDEDGTRLLYVDTNQAAENSRWDSPSHRVIAHLPLLLHPNPKRALVVGFGMGVTSYSITQHGTYVDAVEISPGVVKAAKLYFSEDNNHIFDNDLFNISIEDGRNFILTTERKYDMISTGIIHPLVSSGSSNIYSRDFYELCKRIMTPDGIMSQWVPLHRLPEEHLKIIIRTFIDVFPNTTLWYKYTPDFIVLIGTNKPLWIDYADFVRRAEQPAVREGLAHDDLDAISLLDSFMMDAQTVRRYVGAGKIHTDSRPCLEFFGPGLADTTAQNIKSMKPFRQSVISMLTNYGNTPEEREAVEKKLRRYYEATQLLIDGQIEYARRNYERAAEIAYKAWQMNPEDQTIRYNMEVARNIAIAGIDAQIETTVKALEERIRINPDDVDAYRNLGMAYQELGKINDAISAFRAVKRLAPNDIQANLNLGMLYEAKGDVDRAIEEYENALQAVPDLPLIHGFLATLYQKKGETDKAIASVQKVLDREPDLALAHSVLGSLLMDKGEYEKAEKELKRAIELDPKIIPPRSNLALIYLNRGDLDEAEAILKEAIEIDPNVYEVRLNLAKVLLRRGDYRGALSEARRAAALNATPEVDELIKNIEAQSQ